MNMSRGIKAAAALLATFGMAMQPVMAARAIQAKDKLAKANVVRSAKTANVTMSANKVLTGKIMNAQGVGVEGAVVSLISGQREVARAITTKNGTFTVSKMRPGTYSVAYGKNLQDVRVWDGEIAPPGSADSLNLVSQTPVVRGGAPGALEALVGTAAALSLGSLIVAIKAAEDADDAKRIAQQNGSP